MVYLEMDEFNGTQYSSQNNELQQKTSKKWVFLLLGLFFIVIILFIVYMISSRDKIDIDEPIISTNSSSLNSENTRDSAQLELISYESYGYLDPDIGTINLDEDCFKLNPFSNDSLLNSRNISLNGKVFQINALEAHEDDPGYNKKVCSKDGSWCEEENDWMILEISGKKLEFPREEVKLLHFSNNLSVYIVVADIEGSSSGSASDICINKRV